MSWQDDYMIEEELEGLDTEGQLADYLAELETDGE